MAKLCMISNLIKLQNWWVESATSKACNIQLIFYRNPKSPFDILVKCLLNGLESTLPMDTETFPYYKWSVVKNYYNEKMAKVGE